MRKHFGEFNRPGTVLVVSPYPDKGEVYTAGTSGIASYAKNIVTSLQRKAIVITGYKRRRETYQEENSLVVRCYREKKRLMWLEVIKACMRFNAASKVLIQFDFALYGDLITSALVIPAIIILKILGKKTSLVSHTVVTEVFELAGHVGLGDSLADKIKGKIYNLVFHSFYRISGMICENIIVTEQPLAEKLKLFVRESKIKTVPHGVDAGMEPVAKKLARRKLNISQSDYVVLFFGYLNWFKGADIFAENFRHRQKLLGRNTRFIFAGGSSPTLKDKKYYRKYYDGIVHRIKGDRNFQLTGYVPQEKIKYYLSAADIVIFPYRSFISASGVLSLVFSFAKPFLLSMNLKEILYSADFREGMKLSRLKQTDILFRLDRYHCLKTTEKVLSNGLKKKMAMLAKFMKAERDYRKTALLYEELLFAADKIPSFGLRYKYSTA